MNVFWEDGYKATSIRMLEKEMGINQFSIYASFKNKKELFIKAIQKYREHTAKNIYKDLLKPDAGLSELKTFLLKAADKKTAKFKYKGCLVVNTAAEIGIKDADINREVIMYYDSIYNMLRNILLNSIAKNEISSNINVEQYANFLLGVMQGISVASKTMNTKQLADFVSVAIAQIE
ncbi:MAG: TetR/AcrR family transcriptional regulator [Melioribacteraceae bacterium]|nr:TetR/AcrR family transcriptional regulator [Melioribacteraceae bacterium]MCF8356587.1 TetR/AcrR family transcriptional regulator [Melioribacteraceae bacterium]MCF8395974.1 TetR/AcrR family transcriptional regulator [Melioribacteraceae bacterium]MCF8421025.1 TetR/AcrR family transcriptional regulator [Melioribacteraceae bacterium]